MKKFSFLCFLAMLFCGISAHAADELTFSNVNLAPGSKVEALAQDQQITFNTNMDDAIGYMLAQIEDETGEVVLSNTTVYDPNFNATGVADDKNPKNAPQNKKDPHFTFVLPVTVKMYEGHTYSIVFAAYADKAASQGSGNPLAKGTIKYEGSTPSYVGSRFKLLTITPDPATHVITSEENAAITLHFNGMVRMDEAGTFVNTGFGSSNAFKSISPGDDAETVVTTNKAGEKVSEYVYSTTWTLTPGKSDVTCGEDLLIAANAFDKAGLHVSTGTEYSTGDDETSYYTFTVANDCGKQAFTITPDATTEKIQSLSTFVVGSEAGIAAAGITEPIVLYQVAEDGSKTEVAQVKWNAELNSVEVDGEEAATKLRLFLDKPATKAGKYLLHIPRNYFNFGTGMMAKHSAATDIEYTIAKDADEPEMTFSPDGELKSLSSVLITYPKDYLVGLEEGDDFTLNTKAFIFNESKELVTTASFDYNPNDYNDFQSVSVNLEDKVTTPGKYTLLIPEQSFTVQKDDASVHARKIRAARSTRAEGEDAGDEDWEPGSGEEIEYTFNNGIVKEFTVIAGSIDGVTVKSNPENEAVVSEIQTVDIAFEGAETVAQGSGLVWFKDVKKIGADNKYYDAAYAGNSISMTSETTLDGTTATLKPWNGSYKKPAYGITKDSKVVLNIPEGYFVVNGVDYPEINLVFTVNTATGVNGVEAETANAKKNVYTLSGIKVNGKAPKGVVIVNGKKVINK